MNRKISLAAASGALVALIFSNVVGTSAAGPYVYGCTSLNVVGLGGNERATLSIYNGSATTANLTHKVLSGNGTNLSAGLTQNSSIPGSPALPATSTLGATKTAAFWWDDVHNDPSVTSSTVQATVRVVSDVPVAVSMHVGPSGNLAPCTRLDP
jgi:hypothetical protein